MSWLLGGPVKAGSIEAGLPYTVTVASILLLTGVVVKSFLDRFHSESLYRRIFKCDAQQS